MNTSSTSFALVYARVSTPDQNITEQLQSLRSFCKANKLTIKKEITEKHSAFRPSKLLERALQTFHNGTLVVYSCDRFSRNLAHAKKLLALLKANNNNIRIVTNNLDISCIADEHVLLANVANAEHESTLKSIRSSMYMKNRKSSKEADDVNIEALQVE